MVAALRQGLQQVFRLILFYGFGIIFIGLLGIFTPIVHASTFNTPCDSNQLIADITTASSNGQPSNTINLAVNCSYNLTTANNTTGGQGPNGLPVITGTLTIHGNGATIRRIPFTPFRIFFLMPGSNLTLDNLTIANGNAQGDGSTYFGLGGGIYSAFATLNLTNSTIFSNTALGAGGGVYNYSSTLSVTGSTFWVNATAGAGAGLYNTGTAANKASTTIENAQFLYNYIALSSPPGAIAGGIYNDSVSGDAASLTISNSTLMGNERFGVQCAGGGPPANPVIIANSTISGTNGIGVYCYHLSVTNSSVISNSLDGISGIYVTVTNSLAAYNGNRGILGGLSLEISNSSVVSNTGGGVVSGLNANIHDSTIAYNSSKDNGGGLWINNSNNVTVTNSTIGYNLAPQKGGGIYDYSPTGGNPVNITLVNSTLAHNSANGSGGGIYNLADPGASASVTLSNTLLVANNNGGTCLALGTGATYQPAAATLEYPGPATCGIGVTVPASDPLGGAMLADNGGPTQTFALPAGSAAIDTANAAFCPLTDQRGLSRSVGAGCDIGAFEYGASYNLVVTNTLEDVANPPSGSLRRAVVLAGGQKSSTITFDPSLGLNPRIDLLGPLVLPPNLKIMADCSNRVQLYASFANALQLRGNNWLQGLQIFSSVNPGLLATGAGNHVSCTGVSKL